MISYKKLLALGMSSVLALSFVACGKSKSTKYEPIAEEDETIYHIAMYQDDNSDYYDAIAAGFKDALDDLFGNSHLSLTSQVVGETQLIFASGSKSLTKASEDTEETPIVGAGVMDYQHLLHLTVGAGDSWNKKTGTNVTGISATPNLADQVSLIIESTKDLKTVGLLYSPDDEDALYQLATVEKYLDQAGIAWKEYACPALANDVLNVESDDSDKDSDQANTSDDGVTDIPIITSVITKTEVVAPSITEGSGNDVDILGESNLINGIIAPNSAHAPAISSFWDDSMNEANADQPLPSSDDLDSIIRYAANECSVLFLPTASSLTPQAKEIASIATEAGVVTVGGDSDLGQYTLTSSFADPYAQGYAAGKKAYRILVKGDLPGDIKISKAETETIKLYNGDVAEKFELSFPKSFQEISDFKSSYKIGSSTSRITSEAE